MSTYVISDIHGRADEFFQILDKIKFSSSDILYILGDVMEYEYEPLKIINYIINNPNIILLKGNQEDIFINELKKIIELDYFIDEKGNTDSFKNTIDVIARKGISYANFLLNYLESLPIILKVNDFILVHGDLTIDGVDSDSKISEIKHKQDEHTCLYGRNFVKNDIFIDDITVILGHTIVMTIDRSCETILYKPGKILIDCGASINRKIGCLRLDDMKEFYIEINEEKYI